MGNAEYMGSQDSTKHKLNIQTCQTTADADQAAPASAPTDPARTAQRSNSEEAGCPRVKITRRPPRRRLYPVTSSPTPPCRTTSSMSSCSNFKPLADDDFFYLPTEVAVSRGGLRKNLQ